MRIDSPHRTEAHSGRRPLGKSRPRKPEMAPYGVVPCSSGDTSTKVPSGHSGVGHRAKSTYDRSSGNNIKTLGRHLARGKDKKKEKTTNLIYEGPNSGTPRPGSMCRSSATPEERPTSSTTQLIPSSSTIRPRKASATTSGAPDIGLWTELC